MALAPEHRWQGDRDSMVTRNPVEVVICPDYRPANPYQRLLEAALHPRYVASYGGPALARTRLRQRDGEDHVLLHVHWEDHVYRDAVDAADGAARVDAFIEEIEGFVGDGGGLVWTVHNLEPHVARNPAAQKRLVEALQRHAHRVSVHGVAALSALAARGVPEDRLVLVPHGHFIGAHGPPVDRSRARAALGLDPVARIALLVGRVDAYKGLARLVAAFGEVGAPGLQLAVVGKAIVAVDDILAGLPPARRSRVDFRPGFLPDEQLALWLGACDAVLLPYEDITTSGTLLLALSYARPVVVADHGAILEIAAEGREALLFRAGDTPALAEALERLALLDGAQLAAMSERALARARMYPWRSSGTMMSDVYAGVLLDLPARRRPTRIL
jgi:glycosyltransferase involved in cell wall biosynthesis